VCYDCLIAYSDNYSKNFGSCHCGRTITEQGANFCSNCLDNIGSGICTECELPLGSGVADEYGMCEACSPSMWAGGDPHTEYKCACGVKPAPYNGYICSDCRRNLGDDETICPYCENAKIHNSEVACSSCLAELEPCPNCSETLIKKGEFLCSNCLKA